MCYAIPGKVKEIGKSHILVDYFGEERRVLNELADVSVGDYIYAQGGFVINKVAPREAEEVLNAWKDLFFELREVDLKLTRSGLEKTGVDSRIKAMLDRAMTGYPLEKKDALSLAKCYDPDTLDLVFKSANFLRQKYLKNACCVHGILEISNCCSQACAYCGISTNNPRLPRYRMTPDEVVEAAYEAIHHYGFRALVLQSGENAGYTVPELAEIIRAIKEKSPALIFISFGEIGVGGLETLYSAGARGLLMRFETSNPELYRQLHPGSLLESRLLHLREAYRIGYLILTGGLIGLPGQTLESLVDDLYLAKDLNAEMFSFGPFLPHPDTPLGKLEPVHEVEVLKMLALGRLIGTQDTKILITTAFETLSASARKKGLLAGGNSVMLNVTPQKYRLQYDVYPHRAHGDEAIENQITGTVALLKELGRAPTDLGTVSR